ncbi:MAG TPA: FAD-binding oxidoreductase [Casimicrobiaceae bacterium]|nr:FAD-binding oxidoreductase [Casimicrobiaceae bacterium]
MRAESASREPYWWDAAPREGPVEVALPRHCDVAIIGAGYTGLSAALTLARAGRSAVVLDAGAPGQGASSRSGGMIGHGHRLSYLRLIERFGAEKAKALVREGMASLEFLKALITGEKIDAALQVCGRMRGASTEADYATMAREGDALRRDLGMPVEVLSKADVRHDVAADGYHGGLLFQAHGAVHPALFHRGLLQRARAAGALLAGYTPVTSVRRDSDGFAVDTPRGNLRAIEVIAATNADTGPITPALARRLVPLPSFLIATEPLGESRVRSLIPNGRMIVETSAKHRFLRPSPDGKRLVLGGRAALHPIPLEQAADWLMKELRTLFPSLADVRVSHVWTGNVAMTRSDLPGIGRRDGVWYALGCNGSGVALMPYLGHKVALKILGQPEGETAYDDIPFTVIPFYNGKAWFRPLMTWWFRAGDRLRGD